MTTSSTTLTALEPAATQGHWDHAPHHVPLDCNLAGAEMASSSASQSVAATGEPVLKEVWFEGLLGCEREGSHSAYAGCRLAEACNDSRRRACTHWRGALEFMEDYAW